MPTTGDDEASTVHSAVQQYAALHPTLAEVAEGYLGLVTELLDDAGINYLSVTGRAKSVGSFAAKAHRRVDGKPLYDDPLTQITDQIGVRVITYLRGDVATVAELLADQLEVLDDRDMGQETASQGGFGYASRHLIVALGADRPEVTATLGRHHAQVQIRTVLQHAWAEFEHAIRYKGSIPAEHGPDLDRRFTLAAGLLELADREFSEISARIQASRPQQPIDADPGDPRIPPDELAAFLETTYTGAGWSRPDHYSWVTGLLLELGVTSLAELSALLAAVDVETIDARLGYKYPPGAVRRLDDALLSLYRERYVDLDRNAHRRDLLHARLAKMTDDAS